MDGVIRQKVLVSLVLGQLFVLVFFVVEILKDTLFHRRLGAIYHGHEGSESNGSLFFPAQAKLWNRTVRLPTLQLPTKVKITL